MYTSSISAKKTRSRLQPEGRAHCSSLFITHVLFLNAGAAPEAVNLLARGFKWTRYSLRTPVNWESYQLITAIRRLPLFRSDCYRNKNNFD